MLNFWKQWTRNSNCSRRRSQRLVNRNGQFTPAAIHAEAFESRCVLSVSSMLNVVGADTVLTVNSSGAESITISSNAAGKVVVNETAQTWSAAVVTKLFVNGGTGNNNINISAVTSEKFKALKVGEIHVEGGAGNDRITGSPLNDDLRERLKGGEGAGRGGQQQMQICAQSRGLIEHRDPTCRMQRARSRTTNGAMSSARAHSAGSSAHRSSSMGRS